MTTTATIGHWFRNDLAFRHAFVLYGVMAGLGLTATAAGFSGYADALIDSGAMLMFFLMGWATRRKDQEKHNPEKYNG